ARLRRGLPLQRLRRRPRAAPTAPLLVQPSARRLSRVQGLRQPPEVRRGPRRPRPGQEPRGGRHRAVDPPVGQVVPARLDEGDAAARLLADLTLTAWEAVVAREILRQLNAKLGFLLRVGLGYLTLARQTRTLSGGEAQRINLANQLGSQLVGTLYVLDEPSIG